MTEDLKMVSLKEKKYNASIDRMCSWCGAFADIVIPNEVKLCSKCYEKTQLEVNEANSFEEQFPSIKQLDYHVENGGYQIIKTTGEIIPVTKHFFVPGEVIMRFCLDKQRVKDAIKKCSSAECLIKELGL